MRKVSIGEENVSVQGGVWALVLYEREFAPDHGNFFDDVKTYAANPMEGRMFASPLFLLRCLWAMARNADETFPCFDEWAKSLDIPMQEGAPWTNEVISALNAEIFRSAESDARGASGGKARKR